MRFFGKKKHALPPPPSPDLLFREGVRELKQGRPEKLQEFFAKPLSVIESGMARGVVVSKTQGYYLAQLVDQNSDVLKSLLQKADFGEGKKILNDALTFTAQGYGPSEEKDFPQHVQNLIKAGANKKFLLHSETGSWSSLLLHKMGRREITGAFNNVAADKKQKVLDEALQWVASGNCKWLPQDKNLRYMRILASAGANVNAKDGLALRRAVINLNTEGVKQLYALGASFDIAINQVKKYEAQYSHTFHESTAANATLEKLRIYRDFVDTRPHKPHGVRKA